MFAYHENDTTQFTARKATAVLQANRVQPYLGAIGVTFDMHVRGFVSVTREKEESVWSDAKDRWHGEY
jgi:hypothetical protein